MQMRRRKIEMKKETLWGVYIFPVAPRADVIAIPTGMITEWN